MRTPLRYFLLTLTLLAWTHCPIQATSVTNVQTGQILRIPQVVSLSTSLTQSLPDQTFPLQTFTAPSDFSGYSAVDFFLIGNFSQAVRFWVIFQDALGTTWIQKDPITIQGLATMTQTVSLAPSQWRVLQGKGSGLDFKAISGIQIRVAIPSGVSLPLATAVGDFTFSDIGFPGMILSDTSPDTTPPAIFNLKVDGRTLLSNEYVGTAPVITAQLEDSGIGIATWNLQVLNASTLAVLSQHPVNVGGVGVYSLSYTLNPELAAGHYLFKLLTIDTAGNISSSNTAEAIVQTGLSLDRVMNSPNPFNPNHESTQIDYLLSKPADVDIYIYSLSGELQKHVSSSSGQSGSTTGYNRVIWDGKNEFSETVANGIYVAYVIAKTDGNVQKGKVKLWVRK